MEVFNQRFADADKQSPHDNRAENTPEQDAVLVNARNADAGKDNRHHEDIVHWQALLDQKAGKIFHSLISAFFIPDKNAEQKPRADIGDADPKRMRKTGNFIFAVKDT